eukprot:466616-Amphidinium_carterae.1
MYACSRSFLAMLVPGNARKLVLRSLYGHPAPADDWHRYPASFASHWRGGSRVAPHDAVERRNGFLPRAAWGTANTARHR